MDACVRGKSVGRLSYTTDNSSDMDKIIDELSTILTSGRLRKESRSIIQKLFQGKRSSGTALKIAQKLVMLSPEFHVSNIPRKNGLERVPPPPPTKPCKSYKAVVHLMLTGGCDSFNMLIPHTCNGYKGETTI